LSAAASLTTDAPWATRALNRSSSSFVHGWFLESTGYFRTFTPVALRTDSRLLMAVTVRFSFRAIKSLSIFDSSNAKSCASSWGVHGRPLGRGPSFISVST
jgi:hypothetical protein